MYKGPIILKISKWYPESVFDTQLGKNQGKGAENFRERRFFN